MSNDSNDSNDSNEAAGTTRPDANDPLADPSADQPAGVPGTAPSGAQAPMAPGDEAPAGTPGTGENMCPQCGGSGRSPDGAACLACEGTGTVTVGIGGA